jgi:O-antigen ligase
MLEEYSSAGEDDTSEHRLVLWEYGLEVVEDHPVLGVGLANWMDYCVFMNPNGINGKVCLVAHNTYIEALTELGVTGFVIFVLILFTILILNARTRANAKQVDNRFIWYIAHGLDGGLIGCMAASVFFSILIYPMFWVQLAMTVSLYEISKKQLSGNAPEKHS